MRSGGEARALEVDTAGVRMSRAMQRHARTAVLLGAAAIAALAAPGAARAEADAAPAARIAVGVSGGHLYYEHDYNENGWGLWARFGLARRLAFQLEGEWRDEELGLGGRAILDVLARGRVAGVALVGGSLLLRDGTESWDPSLGYLLETGLGLEYREPRGVFVGLQVRAGERHAGSFQQDFPTPVFDEGALLGSAETYAERYVVLRLDLGAQF